MIMLYVEADEPEWPHVVVTPGNYDVTLHETAEKWKVVRVCLAGVTKAKPGKQVGQVSVDHAAVAICDYDALFAVVEADTDAYSDWTESECEEAVWEKASGVIKFSGVPLAHMKTGVGDGAFPVFELLDGKRVVGLECSFEAKKV